MTLAKKRFWLFLGIVMALTAVSPLPTLTAKAAPDITVSQNVLIGDEVVTEADILAGSTLPLQLAIENNEPTPLNIVIVIREVYPPPGSSDLTDSTVCHTNLVEFTPLSPAIPSNSLDTASLVGVSSFTQPPTLAAMLLELPPNGRWEATADVRVMSDGLDCTLQSVMEAYAATAVPVPDSCHPQRSPNCQYDGWSPNENDVAHLLTQLDPVVAPTLTLTLRVPDLGDAPDSSNHFAAAMTAYPGVVASFPTVFDAATGVPVGPKHLHARPLRLGQRVSREREADLNPGRNLRPPTDSANRDRRDDGLNPATLSFNGCQQTAVAYRLSVEQTAVNYFTAKQSPAYLNIWVDGNQDGDWADGTNCNGTPATEHIVINRPIDVAALGLGSHNLTLLTDLVPWAGSDAAWLRVTLSDTPAPTPLTTAGRSHGDGRGPATAYLLGETEDYLWVDPQAGGGGDASNTFAPAMLVPDLGMALDGSIILSHDDKPKEDPPKDDDWRWRPLTATLKIDFGNFGTSGSLASKLSVDLDDSFSGEYGNIQVSPSSLVDNIQISCAPGDDCRLEADLGAMAPGDQGQLLIRATNVLCADANDPTCSLDSISTTARIIPVNPATDANPANNQETLVNNFNIGMPPGFSSPLSGTTNQNSFSVSGQGEPGATLAIFTDGFEAGDVLVKADGTWELTLTLENGVHRIDVWEKAHLLSALAPTSRGNRLIIKVDDRLSWDPLHTFFGTDTFTYTLLGQNGRLDPHNWQMVMLPDENYTFSAPITCSQPADVTLNIIGILIANLTDPDSDGVYETAFTSMAGMDDKPTRLTVDCGGEVQEFNGRSRIQNPAQIVDASSGEPLAGVQISAIRHLGPTAQAAYDLNPNDVNYQLTSDDNGEVAFWLPPGTYSFILEINGFQTHRTQPRNLFGLQPVGTIPLTPCSGCSNPNHAVSFGDDGFADSFLRVRQGDVVSWLNDDLDSTTLTGDGLNSGTIAGGDSFATRFNTPGMFTIQNSENPLNWMTIIVEEGYRVYLPLVRRP